MPITTITSRSFNQDASGAKRASRDGPVIITERGRPAHVLLNYAEYERLMRPRQSVADMLAMPVGADVDIDLDIPRVIDPLRDVDLS